MVAPFSKFYGQMLVGFCLNTGKRFFFRFHFKDNRKSIDSSKKKVLGIFKIAVRLRDRHVFIWQSVEVLNDSNTLTLKHIFWKMENFFKKLEYRFIVESTKVEKASFPYKTAISEANVKTNKMVSTK